MKVVIAGGSGFLGRALVDSLALGGHTPVVLSRRASASAPGQHRVVSWSPDGTAGSWASEIDGADALVNLAGESIAGGRWTDARKQAIRESREKATRSLVAAIARAATPPPVFVSGSAVGYYGPRGDDIVTEDDAPGSDFLADVCVRWEAEASRAATFGTRVVCVRSGLVLERDGGALPPMLPPFWFGAGGPVGSGRQYWPWIHRQDWIELVRFAIQTPSVSGPLNLTAPEPVANRDFAKTLGRAMRRPALLTTPAFALKVMLGEMADALILSGQRAVPAKAERLGFTFRYRNLASALADLFSRRQTPASQVS